MIYRYELQQIGIGDITFFCGEILNRVSKEDTIFLSLNNGILLKYRDNSESYKKFCFDYIRYILEGYDLRNLETHKEPHLKWGFYPDIANTMLTNKDIKNHINKKFSSENKYEDFSNYIVLFTKVRDFHKENFNKIKNSFFEKINNLGKKVIIIGERMVSYDGEYFGHDKDITYSLYHDYIQNVDSDKVIDLTKEYYKANEINLENMLSDLNLVYSADKFIIFGGGGFFCTSLFTNNLISLNNNENCRIFHSILNENIFLDSDKFLLKI